jgi:uncharacterized protein (DUF1330 family)
VFKDKYNQETGIAFERIMGIDVINGQGYQNYREVMAPILKLFGGAFDYKIDEELVLISK